MEMNKDTNHRDRYHWIIWKGTTDSRQITNQRTCPYDPEKGTTEQFSDKLRMIFLQLPLFTKEADECENQVERWIYLLKNMETLNRLPWAAQSAVFQKLESIADVGGMTRAERLQYDEALKKYRDTISVFEGVRMEGRMEGRREGRMEGNAEGRENEKKATIRRLLASGASVDIIAIATGMSEADVKLLINEITKDSWQSVALWIIGTGTTDSRQITNQRTCPYDSRQ